MSSLVLLNTPGELVLLTCAYPNSESPNNNVAIAFLPTGASSWGAWDELKGQVATAVQVAAALEQNGQIEGFYVDGGGAGTLRMMSTDLGTGHKIADFTVAQNQDGRLEVFAVDTSGTPLHLYETAPNNGWSGWAFLGQGGISFAQQAPAVGLNLDGSLQVFAVDGAGSPRYITQNPNGPNGGWTDWNFLGTGYKIAQLTVARNKDGRLEVFAVDKSRTPLHIWQTTPGGGWSDWAFLGQGGIPIEIPSGNDGVIAAALDNDGRLEAFAVNASDGTSLRIQQNPSGPNGGWTDWVPLGANSPGFPPIAVVADGNGHLVVVEFAPAGAPGGSPGGPCYIAQQAGNAWSANWAFVGSYPPP